MLVCLSLSVWEPSLWSLAQGKLQVEKDLQTGTFKQLVSLSTQYAGRAIFLWVRKGINKECVFRTPSCMNCLTSKAWDLQACQEDLNSRGRADCLPALSKPCEHIPRPHHDCPWGSGLWECLKMLRDILWLPSWGDIPPKMARSDELQASRFLKKSQRVDQT